ncbi:MAG: 4Fe-4S binding protein [Oscillospiraceae bacterium]|nr:4Fe-4S binding protein [Oscillospiraceae bacterium]
MAAKVIFDRDRCKGCELCVDACPVHILALEESTNRKGYHPAGCTDTSKCIGCASCARICPDSVISVYRD